MFVASAFYISIYRAALRSITNHQLAVSLNSRVAGSKATKGGAFGCGSSESGLADLVKIGHKRNIHFQVARESTAEDRILSHRWPR